MSLKDADYIKKVPLCASYRLLVVLCLTATLVFSYGSQASMSSALVCMGQGQGQGQTEGGVLVDADTGANSSLNWTTTQANEGKGSKWKFPWSPEEKAWAVTLFFVGCYVMLFPSSFILVKLGSKTTLMISLTVMTVLQFLAIPAALVGLPWLYVDRFLLGLATSLVFSCVVGIVASWAPPDERSFLIGLNGIGSEFGSVFSFAISSVSCTSDIQGGWPFVFYILGSLGVIITTLNFILVTNVPFTNRWLGEKEKAYLMRTCTIRQTGAEKIKLPIKQIMTSLPMWAIFVSKLSMDLVFFFIMNEAPVFLADVLKLSGSEVSISTGLPYLFVIVTVFIGGLISDRLITNGVLSNTNVRKINDGISRVIPAVLLICLGYLPEKSVALFFVTVSLIVSLIGVGYLGCYANLADVSPNKSAPLLGLSSVFANWIIFVTPVATAAMTGGKSRQEWQTVLYISAGICIATFIFYTIFASGELQPWAIDEDSQDLTRSQRDQHQGQGHGTANDFPPHQTTHDTNKTTTFDGNDLSLGLNEKTPLILDRP